MRYEEEDLEEDQEEEEIEEGEVPEEEPVAHGGGLMGRLSMPSISMPDLGGAGKTARDVAQTVLIALAALFAGLTVADVSGLGTWYASYVEAGLVAGALLLAIWAGSEKWEATAYLMVAAFYLVLPIVAYELKWAAPPWQPLAWGLITTLGSLAINFGGPVGSLMVAASKLKKA